MLRALGYFREYRDWRMIVFAGVLGVVIALTMMEIITAPRLWGRKDRNSRKGLQIFVVAIRSK